MLQFGWIIFILLMLTFCMMVWLVVRVQSRFKNLSNARLAVYLEFYEYVYGTMISLRKREALDEFDPVVLGKISLIGSHETTGCALRVFETFSLYMKEVGLRAPDADLSEIRQAAEGALNLLYLAMRKDLALHSGGGRTQNAEALRNPFQDADGDKL